ncbi:MAG: hypothetical protein ACI8S6_002449 [Myxococcota bacterium]|jgi:hypothetical protein
MSGLSALPPRQRLSLILSALCRRLPVHVGSLLDAPRFSEARSALLRLADPRRADAAMDSMSDAEAAWLAEVLWSRWASIGQPALDPMVLVIAPAEIWVGASPVRVPVDLVVLGVEDGWSVRWSGPVIGSSPPVLIIEPPRTGAPWQATVEAAVRARIGERTVELSARHELKLRRPSVTFDTTRRRVTVRDQSGTAASGVRVQIGDAELETVVDGTARVRTAFPPHAPVRVEGFLVGRVPPPGDTGLDEPTVEMKRRR